MKKIILFGGSFDPVHWGHMAIASAALKQRKADEVWFVLNQNSPFKQKGTSFEDRHKMLEIMLNAYSKHFKICDIDKDLPQPSYAINTVESLAKDYPNYKFDWLIGSDQIEKLDQWHRFDEFKDMVNFIVYKRDDSNHDYQEIQGKIVDVSSTEIRKGLSTGTHKKILNYMMDKGLYLETMLEERLSKKRLDHTLRVSELAMEIAGVHNLDTSKVYLAAMFHDYCKENYDDAFFINESGVEAFSHAYAAVSLLAKRYYYKDKEVLRAIYNHVDGKANGKIAQVLFIADKCEPGRNYDASHLIALAKKNLNDGFKAVKEENKKYLEKRIL